VASPVDIGASRKSASCQRASDATEPFRHRRKYVPVGCGGAVHGADAAEGLSRIGWRLPTAVVGLAASVPRMTPSGDAFELIVIGAGRTGRDRAEAALAGLKFGRRAR